MNLQREYNNKSLGGEYHQASVKVNIKGQYINNEKMITF